MCLLLYIKTKTCRPGPVLLPIVHMHILDQLEKCINMHGCLQGSNTNKNKYKSHKGLKTSAEGAGKMLNQKWERFQSWLWMVQGFWDKNIFHKDATNKQLWLDHKTWGRKTERDIAVLLTNLWSTVKQCSDHVTDSRPENNTTLNLVTIFCSWRFHNNNHWIYTYNPFHLSDKMHCGWTDILHKSNSSNFFIHLGGVLILCYSTDLCCNEAQLFEEDSTVYPLPGAAALPFIHSADMTLLNVC